MFLTEVKCVKLVIFEQEETISPTEEKSVGLQGGMESCQQLTGAGDGLIHRTIPCDVEAG